MHLLSDLRWKYRRCGLSHAELGDDAVDEFVGVVGRAEQHADDARGEVTTAFAPMMPADVSSTPVVNWDKTYVVIDFHNISISYGKNEEV